MHGTHGPALPRDLSEILEQTRLPDPELVELIELAFIQGQIDSKRAELAYLWSLGVQLLGSYRTTVHFIIAQ